MAVAIEVTDKPAQEALDLIGKGLTSFNEADVGPADRRPLAVLVHDAEQNLIAGISGYTAWGWLYVQWLWVAEGNRGQNLAGRMLTAAEAEARQRLCHGSYIDTFNPHALHVYQKAGYRVFGTLPNFPPGRIRSFLSKDL